MFISYMIIYDILHIDLLYVSVYIRGHLSTQPRLYIRPSFGIETNSLHFSLRAKSPVLLAASRIACGKVHIARYQSSSECRQSRIVVGQSHITCCQSHIACCSPILHAVNPVLHAASPVLHAAKPVLRAGSPVLHTANISFYRSSPGSF